MLGRNKSGAFILTTIALVLTLCLPAHCEKASTPDTGTSVQSKEPVEVSVFVSTDYELSARIKQLVKGLEYSDKVAEDFIRMAMAWKDEKKRSIFIRWGEKLTDAHQDYQKGKLYKNQVAKIEEGVLRELCERVRRQYKNKRLGFELSDVIENRHADCLGFTQLIYIAGNAVGLLIRPIEVLDPLISPEGEVGGGHIACIMDLFDGRLVMADVLLLFEIPSRAFKLEDQFVKVGNYWELRDKDNPLLIHKRIRLLDRKGLIAAIAINRGYAYKSKGEYDRAVLEYNKAIEIDPRFNMSYNNLGNIYRNKGEYDRAILDFTKAIEIDPKDAIAYTNRGRAFYDKGKYDRAIKDHTKAIELNPKFTEAHNNRAGAYFIKGEYDHAILDFTKAIMIDPNDADAYVNRGVCYYKMDEYDKAILDFTKAIEINPKDAYAYIVRGDIYHIKKGYDQAILDFTKAIEINPDDAHVYAMRGAIYVSKGEYDRAIEDCTKGIEINPRFIDAYNNRGCAFSEKKEYRLAILDYEKVIEIDPDYALAYLNRAEVYAKLGKSEEAKKDLLKALELDPELKESAKELSEQYELNLKPD